VLGFNITLAFLAAFEVLVWLVTNPSVLGSVVLSLDIGSGFDPAQRFVA
jgi:hypothetical protein